MLEFLPQNIKNGIERINLMHVYEIRLRVDKPVIVNYQGEYRYLGLYGLTQHRTNAIFCTAEDIADCVFKAGNYSVYSVEEQLKQGFLTAEHGERIGLAGEYVFEDGKPLVIRNFMSLCIRVPHEIKGCAADIYNLCMSDRVRSVLLMSAPGLGKTTILRDLSRLLSENTRKNLLICDERGELSIGDIGDTCDVIRFCDKETAFTAGIRAMRPEIIITDELSERDCTALRKAVSAGIQVIASAHYSNMHFVSTSFRDLFERFILLNTEKLGRIKAIYDKSGQEVIC